MALVPSIQLSLDSLQSPFSKFHGTSLHFFRYNSSFRHLKPPSSSSSTSQYPPRKYRFMAIDNTNSQNDKKDITLTSSDWFFKWNKPNKDNGPKPPQAALDYSEGGGGGRGSTMDRIVEKLRNFGYVEEGDGDERKEREPGRVMGKGSVEDIFHVDEGMLPNSRGGFSRESPLGVESVFKSDGEVRFPWEKPRKDENEGEGKWTARSKSRTSLAELTLPDSELKRLRNLTYQMKRKIRVKGSGVTEEVVNTIHERWKTSEIVRVKVEGAPALNMKRVHEILERKTGGLVIWRSGTSISLYRGVSYEVPSVQQNKKIFRRHEIPAKTFAVETSMMVRGPTSLPSPDEMGESQLNSEATSVTEERKEIKLHTKVDYEDEVDKLLDGLGPRYMDWPGCEPLPVDADMLPGIVPGYQPPFRLLPYGMRPTLGQKEGTSLRRLARVLPPHFALGRSRQLQGLAVAMIKLWEKSSIAKIALKRGVQLTTSERMAEDLKKLTGGILLSRNKDFLVFYRGKNFLSPDVTEALLERERLAKSLQDEEEQARLRASAFVIPSEQIIDQSGTAGTLEETLDANSRWGKKLDGPHREKIMREAEIVRHNSIVRKLERKLAFAERRLMKAEQALSKVEEFLKPAERQADPESITDEERFMFRKLGLRMKAFLLLGRRGVFDGTVENMHLHWKYRELVKILLKAKSFEQVKKIALALEAESGGILVSVDKVSKGYAIIVFRGKDYKRPSTLRPKNLLTKRKALARSIEIQRREALLNHVSALHTKVEKLRSEIEQMDNVEGRGDEELYDKLDSSYHSDDGETEEEGDEAYLETYNGENEVNYGDDDEIIRNANHENKFSYYVQDHEVETEPEDAEDEANLENYNDDTDDYNDDTYDDEHGNDVWVQDSRANFPQSVHDHIPQGS